MNNKKIWLAIAVIAVVVATYIYNDVSKSPSEAWRSGATTAFTGQDYVMLGSPSDLVIPDTYTTIDDRAFFYCSNLKSVVIPSTITSLGEYAFGGCSNLTSVTLPSSVTSIGDYAFNACNKLESIVLSDSLKSIGVRAFYECSYLNNVKLPDSLIEIGGGAFSWCNRLTEIDGGENFVLKSGVLYDRDRKVLVSALKAVVEGDLTLPSSVVTIGSTAFYGCNDLTSVVLPDHVTTVGEDAFWMCSSLKHIYVSPTSPAYEDLKRDYRLKIVER